VAGGGRVRGVQTSSPISSLDYDAKAEKLGGRRAERGPFWKKNEKAERCFRAIRCLLLKLAVGRGVLPMTG